MTLELRATKVDGDTELMQITGEEGIELSDYSIIMTFSVFDLDTSFTPLCRH